MIDFSQFDSLIAMTMYFNNEDVCKNAIIETRWGKGEQQDVVCPYCGGHHCVRRADGRFRCKACKKNFSCLVGTIFQNTKVSLLKWFMAMYFVSYHKKGISSYQLAKNIDVTQATAWYMLSKIRLLFKQECVAQMSGTVECDEVYIGGKEKWKHKSMRTPHTQGRSTLTKTPIFGMMQRMPFTNDKGEQETMSIVHAFVVKKVDSNNLLPIITEWVRKGSHIITDECNAYNSLKRLGYAHSIVNHGNGEYAKGNIFTNSIECFWSHFRRMISGCYHNISDEHLQFYIDEQCFRWNTRKTPESLIFSRLFDVSMGLVVKWGDLRLCA